jgi:hypothetical protein
MNANGLPPVEGTFFGLPFSVPGWVGIAILLCLSIFLARLLKSGLSAGAIEWNGARWSRIEQPVMYWCHAVFLAVGIVGTVFGATIILFDLGVKP